MRRQEMGEKAENWGLVGWESEPAALPEPLLLLLAWEVHQRELKLMLRVRVSGQICWVLLGETKAGSWVAQPAAPPVNLGRAACPAPLRGAWLHHGLEKFQLGPLASRSPIE